MGGSFSRSKGQRGEREICKLLTERLGFEVKRNLQQYQDGGCDLVGLDKYAIEIKRQETELINSWWQQTKRQAKGRMPVLFYRSNRKPWLVMTEASSSKESVVMRP